MSLRQQGTCGAEKVSQRASKVHGRTTKYHFCQTFGNKIELKNQRLQ